jgi:hypothetical protein
MEEFFKLEIDLLQLFGVFYCLVWVMIYLDILGAVFAEISGAVKV